MKKLTVVSLLVLSFSACGPSIMDARGCRVGVVEYLEDPSEPSQVIDDDWYTAASLDFFCNERIDSRQVNFDIKYDGQRLGETRTRDFFTGTSTHKFFEAGLERSRGEFELNDGQYSVRISALDQPQPVWSYVTICMEGDEPSTYSYLDFDAPRDPGEATPEAEAIAPCVFIEEL